MFGADNVRLVRVWKPVYKRIPGAVVSTLGLLWLGVFILPIVIASLVYSKVGDWLITYGTDMMTAGFKTEDSSNAQDR
jgi:hypothetical protein